jgi:pilus assembly protein CpaF
MSNPTTTTSSAPEAQQDRSEFCRLRRQLVEKISGKPESEKLCDPSTRESAERRLPQEIAAAAPGLSDAAKAELAREVLNEMFGFGPIQSLLEDPSVTEVMVNRADRVYVERSGKSIRTNIVFDDDAHIRRVIQRIIVPLGKRLDENCPLADARLPDGSRVNVAIPPVAINGSCITIRKFSKSKWGLDDLVKFGSMPQPIADFFKACVQARLNIVVTGGTGSGKTTLLNALSACIPDEERIVTIEDAAELKMSQDHVITLEAKRPNIDGSGEVTIRELVRNALRMRPERIIVGECRGGEALDMLQAMNTGHDGSLTTLHANSPRDAISRIETMALMAGIDFPIRVIREQVASAIQLLIHQSRLRDGSRKITYVSEIAGMEGEKLLLQEIFRFVEKPASGTAVDGILQPCGLRPRLLQKIENIGIKLSSDTFVPNANQNAGAGRRVAAA